MSDELRPAAPQPGAVLSDEERAKCEKWLRWVWNTTKTGEDNEPWHLLLKMLGATSRSPQMIEHEDTNCGEGMVPQKGDPDYRRSKQPSAPNVLQDLVAVKNRLLKADGPPSHRTSAFNNSHSRADWRELALRAIAALAAAPSVAYYESDDMSLRDYFAAKAMQVEIETASRSVKNADALVRAAGRNGMTIEQRIAHNAYSMADAMLAERSKP